MKKVLAITVFLCTLIQPLMAEHIKGGELHYEYLGNGASPNTSRYRLTLKLYIDCSASSPGQIDSEVSLTIFDRLNNMQVGGPITARFVSENYTRFDPASNPCITNAPTDVCYRIRVYSVTVDLANNAKGYTVAFQRCCRIRDIKNMQAPSDNHGATYLCEIPGSDVYADAYQNSSPVFNTNDAVAICVGSNFTFDFSATDKDGDSIVYRLCNAYTGGGPSSSPNNNNCLTCPVPIPAAPPPYPSIPYGGQYSGSFPLGGNASINPETGIFTGTAPSVLGQYVVTACAYEYREGVLINTHRKDIHVRVSDCLPLKALLKPDYSYCDDFLVTFKNEQLNPSGSIYIWNYGDGSKPDTTTDIEGRVQHQFMNAGSYNVKLKVILAGQCIDSTTTVANVYPGFYPGFTVQGTCILLPLQFTDTTKARYGAPSKWTWDFGDETTLADSAKTANPSWKYSSTGYKTVRLIVESSVGCRDTVVMDSVRVSDKPPITMAFKDTLICSIDSLQLNASGNGVFSWAPSTDMLFPNTNTPVVWPKTTTRYTVTLNENGCVNTDTVQVRVVDFVTLSAGPDQTICLTDTTQLHPVTDGLAFVWSSTPGSPINDVNAKEPLVAPTDTTVYRVIASIGKCSASDDVLVQPVPYPIARAGADTIICFEDTASLHASMVGSRFVWAPANTLSTPQSLSTLAWPRVTTFYVLAVYDTLGCPKPGKDTVQVLVRDEILAFAGNDTSIVLGQPLQMNGTGAELIEWQPPFSLSRNDISNPVAMLDENMTYIMRAYTPEGCHDYDTINIKVFKTSPDIFVPNAFRPGGSRNHLLRPIPVGISKLDYFRVYNRWGQLVFQTSQVGRGWDGTLGGKMQDSGAYVWMVSGTDYTGKNVKRKGTAILIK